MNKIEIVEKAKGLLGDMLELDVTSIQNIKVNSELIKELNMTSIDALQFLVVIEREFSITIEDEELTAELIQSLDSLSDFILQKIS